MTALGGAAPRFTPALFRFLAELKAHNDRGWFAANRERYLRDVQEPFLAFIRAAAPGLTTISRHLVVSARPVGGSMFKIHRDVRFTKDKRPFHTRVAARFMHGGDKVGHGPGFYLHLEPGDCSAGCGVWQPPTDQAFKIRTAIAASPGKWKGAVASPAFTASAQLWGEVLKRPPQGFRADHPLLAALKRRDFVAFTEFTEAEACAADFRERFLADCRVLAPLNRFLAGALGLPW